MCYSTRTPPGDTKKESSGRGLVGPESAGTKEKETVRACRAGARKKTGDARSVAKEKKQPPWGKAGVAEIPVECCVTPR